MGLSKHRRVLIAAPVRAQITDAQRQNEHSNPFRPSYTVLNEVIVRAVKGANAQNMSTCVLFDVPHQYTNTTPRLKFTTATNHPI